MKPQRQNFRLSDVAAKRRRRLRSTPQAQAQGCGCFATLPSRRPRRRGQAARCPAFSFINDFGQPLSLSKHPLPPDTQRNFRHFGPPHAPNRCESLIVSLTKVRVWKARSDRSRRELRMIQKLNGARAWSSRIDPDEKQPC